MTLIDYIALAIILFLLICAIRYIIRSRKKDGCSGCCGECPYKECKKGR